mmetsp:Transcript_862/g.2684  ORF Transcript_862/g.2684 Transcript_862/m.2684 type:complete len:205 (-) Transcript_862:2390-3004(-)
MGRARRVTTAGWQPRAAPTAASRHNCSCWPCSTRELRTRRCASSGLGWRASFARCPARPSQRRRTLRRHTPQSPAAPRRPSRCYTPPLPSVTLRHSRLRRGRTRRSRRCCLFWWSGLASCHLPRGRTRCSCCCRGCRSLARACPSSSRRTSTARPLCTQPSRLCSPSRACARPRPDTSSSAKRRRSVSCSSRAGPPWPPPPMRR